MWYMSKLMNNLSFSKNNISDSINLGLIYILIYNLDWYYNFG